MKIIAADDEINALQVLHEAIAKAIDDAEIVTFRKPREVIEYVKKERIDIAFLDIEMRGMSGVELAKILKSINPKINVIFVTGYSQYMQEAFSMHASGYVMKPVTPEMIKNEVENLRHPVERISNKRIRVQTFGNFEVFVDGKPLKFKYAKTKELLAYLIDRKGALCTNGEILVILWENDEGMLKKRSYISNLRSDLINTFADVGCKDIIDKQRSNIGVVTEKIECDYFDWLESKSYAINTYQGEYMSQYSWAEMTLGEIEANK